ncbi:hypothetical protein PGT21_031086 [Puccinia graminis f. sp. tritici]|uniref:Uncharacterized protein n=1 Tax=Puccinia graminis f. sp. tritici TaxID=56615 RepID=A0A5B0MGE6_PUCGR|nr:hypothetical protein PGT21_031086 [Puccinia graminis f. sp. tritici]
MNFDFVYYHIGLLVISCLFQQIKSMDALAQDGKIIGKMTNSVSSSGIVGTEAKFWDQGAPVTLPEISEAELRKYIETVNPLYKQDIIFPNIIQANSFQDDFDNERE